MLYIICDQRHAVKHGLAMDWTKKTWTGLEKHGQNPGFRETWTQPVPDL